MREWLVRSGTSQGSALELFLTNLVILIFRQSHQSIVWVSSGCPRETKD